MGGRRAWFWGATFKLSGAIESFRLRQSDYGYLACGYLPRSSEKRLGSLHAACQIKTAGRWTPLCPRWVWSIDLNPIFKHSPLVPLSERTQLWKSRLTDVRGLWEWVCHGLSCSCLLHCCLCFLLPLSFILFSWERENFCPELELHMTHFIGLWDDKSRRNLVAFSSTVSCCLTGDFSVFLAYIPSILISSL